MPLVPRLRGAGCAQVKGPKQTGQLGYARATREGIRMATVCVGYPETQLSKDNIAAIQKAIGWLVDVFPEEGSPRGQRSRSAMIRKPVTGWPDWCLP
jgi:hypothetical protein